MFGDVGSGASGEPFTYTSGSQFFITLLDGFASGDQFQLFANGSLVGTTTTPTVGAPFCINASMCLADDAFSRGTFLLDAGSYAFTLKTIQSPLREGGAYLGVNVSSTLAGDIATVPEPASASLLAGGLLALGGVAIRRRRLTSH